MKELRDKILQEGYVINSNILKVDSFLNHQIDPNIIFKIGEEFKRLFSDKKIDKVLTIEASGIAIGMVVSYALNVPLVFAKKNKPSTMNDTYNSIVHSFTKNTDYNVCVGKHFLKEGENILIVDDFLALGNAILGLLDICNNAKANVVGVGIVIEKGFQDGGKILRNKGINLKSLAIIDSLENNEINIQKAD